MKVIYETEIPAGTKPPEMPGSIFMHALTEGEAWAIPEHGGGMIVTHPDRHPLWVRIEGGVVVKTIIEPPKEDRKPAETPAT